MHDRLLLLACGIIACTVYLWPSHQAVDQDAAAGQHPGHHSEAVAAALDARLLIIERELTRVSAIQRNVSQECCCEQPDSFAAQRALLPTSRETDVSPDPTKDTLEVEKDEDVFQRELQQGTDVAATAAIEKSLRSDLERLTTLTSLQTVRCSAGLCRCVFSHSDEDSQRYLAAQLTELDLTASGVSYEYHAEGTTFDTVAYIARQRHER